MAGYDAAINVVVNGQNKIDKLITSLSSVDKLVGSLSKEPINLDLKATESGIAAAEKLASDTIKKITRDRSTAIDKFTKIEEKYKNTITRNQLIIADAQSRGATNTKKYATAVAAQENAIKSLSAAQKDHIRLIEEMGEAEVSARARREESVASLEKSRKTIESINRLARQYINLGERSSREQGVPLANLQAQVDLFRQLSNSVKTTSEDYRRFTLASVTAEIDTARESLKKYQIIADAAIPRGGGSSAFGVKSPIEYKGLQAAIQELINAFPQVAKSEAGLQSYRDTLASTLSLIPYGTDQYIKLAGAIKQVDQAMSARLSTADAAKPFGPAEAKLIKQGPAIDLVSQGLKERQLYADRKLKVDQNLNRLAEKIEDTIGDQGERTRLLVQANQALNALAEDRLEDAARELAIIERQRRAYSRLEKQQVQGKFTPLGGGAEAAARQRFEREQVGAAQKTAATRMGWNTALAKLDDFAKEVAQLADSKKAKNKMTWSLAFSKANEIAEELQVLADRKDNTTKMNWNLAIEALNDIASDLAATSAQKGKVIKANWTVSLGKLEDFLAEGFAGASTGGGKPGRMAVSPISGASRAGIIPGSPADKQRTARARLSWLTFFSQALDVAADQTTAATQDAVKLAQQKTKEIERQTAQLWRQFGGPALPPKFGGSSGGARSGGSIGQAFRAGGPGAALASLSSPQRLASQQTSATLLAEKLNNLEIKGVNTTAERKRLQEIVNDLSAKDLQLSDELLNNFDVQLNSIRDYIRLQNQVVANDRAREAAAKKGGAGGTGGAGGASETGFAKTLKTLSESLEESRSYFGNKGPAQAIDQIVRAFGAGDPGAALKSQGSEIADNVSGTFSSSIKKGAGRMTSAAKSVFNQVTQAINDVFGIASPSRFIIELIQNLASTYVSQLQKEYPRIKAATQRAFGDLPTERPVRQLIATGRGFEFVDRPSTGYRPLPVRSFEPSGAGGEMDEMLQRFRYQIAKLTTQPEIYGNILNALPSSALTTDLAALASERARGAEIRGFMDVQRQLGPGELERYIQGQLAEALKGIRIPNPWIGPIGDYEKFIEDVTATTKKLIPLLSGGKVPLALPPAASGQIKQYGPLATTTGRARAAIPPAFDASSMIVDVIASVIKNAEVGSDAEAKKLLDRIRDLFNGLFNGIRTTAQAAYDSLRRGAASLEDQIGPSDFESAFDFTSPQAMQRASTRLGAQGGRFSIGTFSLFPSEGAIGPAGSGEKALDSLSSAVEDFVDRIRNSVSRITSFAGGGGGIPPFGGGAPGAPGDPEDFVRRVGQATTAEALLGLDELRNVRQLSSRELQLLSAAIEEVQQNLRPATADFDRFNNEITQLSGRIGIEQAARNPDADFFARRRIGPRTGRALSEGLVGGAFPLLFGQGLGASVFGGLGGAAGGFAGGGLGFGLSLVGTALGTAFDTTVAAALELGGALNDLSTTFEVVKNRALFSSRETEKLASKLEEAGLVASASILAQEEVIRKIGTSGVRDLKNLETASDRLSRAWAEFTLQLQVALAGPMAGLLEWVTSIVAQGNQVRRGYAEINDVRSRLSDKDRKEFDRRAAEIDSLSKLAGINNPKRITREEAIARQVELAREYAPRIRQRPASAAASAEQLLESQLTGAETFVNALNAKLSALDLGKSLIDQVKNATQEQEDLDRQRAKAIEDYERAIGDIRLGVERRVTQERLNNLAKENEIYSKQGDIRLQQLKNENAIARESLRGNDLGQQLFDIVAQYSEEQLATENEIANRRRSLEAELQSVAIETEQYKVDVAKQVADLNRSTAEQVQQIQLSAARKQDQSARNRFELEKQIAIAQIKVQELSAKQEARKLETLIKGEKDAGVKADLQASLRIYKGFFEGGGANPFTALENQVKGLKPPAQLSYAGFNVGQGVSTAGYDAVIAKGNELKLRLEELAKALDSLVAAGKFVEVNTLLKNLADQGAAEAANKSKELRYQFDLLTGAAGAVDPRLKELAKGQAKLLETTAGSKEEFKQLVPLYIQLAEQNIKAADTYQFFNSAIDDNLGQIESLKEEINNLLAGTTEYEKALQSLTQRGLSPASEEAQRLLASAQELDRLKDKIEVINNIRDAATGFTESLRGLVEQFIELKDAGKAVKAFSEELGKKSLSFVLDLAFKPIEETMQKQFIAFADKLGIDVRPEALKQLTELQQINANVDSINKKIEPIISSLAAQQKKIEAEALAKAQQQQALAAQVGAGGVYGQTSGPASTQFGGLRKELADWLRTYDTAVNAQLREIYSAQQVTSASNITRAQTLERIKGGANFNQQEKFLLEKGVNDIINNAIQERIKQLSAMTGQGGPDIPDSRLLAQSIVGDRTPSPLPGQSFEGQKLDPTRIVQGVDVPRVDGDLPAPGVLPQGTQLNPVYVKNVDSGVMPAAGAAQSPAANAANEMSAGTQKAASDLEKANGQWLRNLGTTVTALAGAATGVLAIAGGVSQIKEGGVYGTLTGLAGIFGGIASITSMFGTGGALSGVFGGGAPGGSIAPGPVAQSAGVTYSPGYYGPAFKAAGGPVLGGSPYIVGEQGPELFVPKSSGTIISNDDLFSATRDAMASGAIDGEMGDEGSEEPGLSSYRSTFSGSQGDQKALQEAREAIQAVNGVAGAAGANGLNGVAGADGQQMLYDANGNPIGMFASTRSAVASADLAAKARANESSLFGANKDALAVAAGGGVAGPLAATRMQVMQQQAAAERNSELTRIESIANKPAKMDISYKSQVINNVEYVTVEQAERMSRESAKKGRDLAIGALQASVKARRTAGLI